jgi:hypothetical protein
VFLLVLLLPRVDACKITPVILAFAAIDHTRDLAAKCVQLFRNELAFLFFFLYQGMSAAMAGLLFRMSAGVVQSTMAWLFIDDPAARFERIECETVGS